MKDVDKILASLEEVESHNRLIIQNSLDAIIAMDAQGAIIQWNRQAETIFGWKKEAVLGQKLSETIIPQRLREAHERGLQRFLNHGVGPVLNKRIEVAALHQQGHEFPIELAISPLKHGDTFRFSAFIRDITEQKKFQDNLKTAKEAAESASRAKSDFLANMSHEIRTPMNGIMGMVELLLDTPLNAEQQEFLQIIKESSNALLTVINDILDFSKIEAGKLELEFIPFPIKELIQTTLKVIAIHADQKKLELIEEVAANVPAHVRGDPGRLRQVLLNLLSNAIKFTEAGEIKLRVEKEAEEKDWVCLHFWVVDTGVGIAPEKIEKIFSAFTQGDSSNTRRYGGTGLGLSISSQLVKMMGGDIHVDSKPEQGSSFDFTVMLGKD